MTLTLYTAIQSLCKTLSLVMMYYQCLVAKGSGFTKYTRNHYNLIIQVLTVTLTLKITKQSLCMVLQVMAMHHHTKFGFKR